MNAVEKEFMEGLEVNNVFKLSSSFTLEEKKKLFELLFEIRDFYKKRRK